MNSKFSKDAFTSMLLSKVCIVDSSFINFTPNYITSGPHKSAEQLEFFKARHPGNKLC